MRALGFEPKKEEIRKMIADIDKDGSGKIHIFCVIILSPTELHRHYWLQRISANDDSKNGIIVETRTVVMVL